MKLATLIQSTTAALLLSASLASAQVPPEYTDNQVIQQFAEQIALEGFEIVSIKTTLLGRYKIEAVSAEYGREIVLTAGTGAILRDKWDAIAVSSPDDTSTPEGVDGRKDSDPDHSDSPDNPAHENGSDQSDSDQNDSDQNGSDGSSNDSDSNDGAEDGSDSSPEEGPDDDSGEEAQESSS